MDVVNGMRFGVPVTNEASDEKALYVRCMYHEWYYGPFASEDDVVTALKTLDKEYPYWDYDPFAIHYGVEGMKDALNDPVYITGEARKKIESLRRGAAWMS